MKERPLRNNLLFGSSSRVLSALQVTLFYMSRCDYEILDDLQRGQAGHHNGWYIGRGELLNLLVEQKIHTKDLL